MGCGIPLAALPMFKRLSWFATNKQKWLFSAEFSWVYCIADGVAYPIKRVAELEPVKIR